MVISSRAPKTNKSNADCSCDCMDVKVTTTGKDPWLSLGSLVWMPRMWKDPDVQEGSKEANNGSKEIHVQI